MVIMEPKKIALLIAVLAGFLTPFDLSAVNIALPTLASEFSMDAVTLSWVATAYLLASAVFLVPFGRIADIHGRKKIFSAGLMVFTFASFAMVFSVSPSMIILLRVVQGIGAALIFGTSVAILTSVTPPQERGKALGIYTTAVYLGLSMGPFLGGFLTTSFGWRSIFLVNVPVGILILAIVRTKLEGEWADARGESFDISGALLYGLALVCVMFGFSLLPDVSGMVLVTAGTLVLAAFLWWEHRTPSPLINLSLFLKNRVFAFSNLAALINYSATFSVTFFLSFYLQYIRGFSPAVAGTILVTQPVVQAVFSSYAGRLSDRIEPGRIASAGMAMTAGGLFLLSLLSADTPLTYLIGTLILLGLGFAFFSSPNTNAIMSSVAKPYYGVASGTLGTMRLVGQMLSMGIAMVIISLFIGRFMITPYVSTQLLMSIRAGFTLFALLCCCGVFFSLVRGKLRDNCAGTCPEPEKK
jgi:EmrB/QacA subfamily drug resistance transporter